MTRPYFVRAFTQSYKAHFRTFTFGGGSTRRHERLLELYVARLGRNEGERSSSSTDRRLSDVRTNYVDNFESPHPIVIAPRLHKSRQRRAIELRRNIFILRQSSPYAFAGVTGTPTFDDSRLASGGGKRLDSTSTNYGNEIQRDPRRSFGSKKIG